MTTTASNSSTTTLLSTLEHAADVMMAAPGVVSEAQRKQAEQYFIEMRQANKISLATCRSVLGRSEFAFKMGDPIFEALRHFKIGIARTL